MVFCAILCWTVLLCVHYAVCVLSWIRTLICAQVMSNEALLDESLIIRFSASHHIRFAQKNSSRFSKSVLIAKSKSCILIKRSSFLGNYFLPNCSLSPFAATAEAIPLMAVLNLLRERPVSSEEHHTELTWYLQQSVSFQFPSMDCKITKTLDYVYREKRQDHPQVMKLILDWGRFPKELTRLFSPCPPWQPAGWN